TPGTEYVYTLSAMDAANKEGLRTTLLSFKTTGSGPTLKNSIAVPSSGNITIKGHGYGHGIGMSQHGAQGAARQGVKYDKILSHYYPGTTLGTKSGNIRVHLTADNDNDVTVVSDSSLKFRTLLDNRATSLPTAEGGKS